MINILMVVLFQLINLPTPQFPYMETPTPVPSITPAPTFDASITLTPSGILADLSTAQAEVHAQQTQVFVYNDQIYYEARPLFPGSDATVWSYTKYVTSSAGQSLFGSFSPVVMSFGTLVLIAMIFLVIMFLEKIITMIVKLITFLIRYFVPFVG